MVIGAAYDIVTHSGVPRYLHNDLPLGNPLGKPFDPDMQLKSVEAALELVDSASAPVVVESGLRWSTDESWKSAFMKIDDSNRELLRQMGIENRLKRKAQKDACARR